MRARCLDDLACPAAPFGERCGSPLTLGIGPVPVLTAPDCDGADEIVEGVLGCASCGAEYPIVGGLAVVVGGIDTYLASRLSEILATVAPYGVSAQLHTHLAKGGVGQYDAGYAASYGESAADVDNYICAHFDRLADVVEGPPAVVHLLSTLGSLDFYAEVARLATEGLERRALALDIGCSVGGLAWRLAPAFERVYGIELSFRSAFAARRLLVHRPDALTSYRLHDEGLRFTERRLSVGPIPRAEVLVASAMALPFPDGSADLACCMNLLELVPSPSGLIDECARAVLSGGTLVVADPYCWNPRRGQVAGWFGSGERTTASAVREYLERSCDLTADVDDVPWILRSYRRLVSLWLVHIIRGRKRPVP